MQANVRTHSSVSSRVKQRGGGELFGQHLDLAAGKRVNECPGDQ